MPDDLKKYKERERGMKAQALLDDTILNEILDELVDGYIDAWGASPINDVERRENCYHMVKAIANIREQLVNVAAGGRMADEAIKREEANG